ncbi:MAG: twin-arginine translocation signal domain-containing protein [Gemmatimonadota bacterium]|nr:twin-arginine translocation signal domain-containing protein [Gemmatimonadota bacterium]
MRRSFLKHSTITAALLAALSSQLFGQHSHDHPDTAAASRTSHVSSDPMNRIAGDWKMEAMANHMAYSSTRPLTVQDSARAAYVINELRQAIAKYQDVKVAEADGYKMFAPEIKNQPQYHFTKGWNAIRNQFGFDPARPTSLLYKKNAKGELVLIGAMYTASKRASEEDLNERVPLSVAHWHRHINWCIPPRGQKERFYETKSGRPVFGPLGVASEEDCKDAGGRFILQVFGWMIHVNTFAGNDLKSIWHDDHMMDHNHAMLGDPKNPD